MSARVGVVGWPVAHSRSPIIFGHWFARYGIEATYEVIPVSPDDADGFFATFADGPYRGVNVTIPHKTTAFSHVRADAAASAMGAVNTVWREGEVICGTSSDGDGFLASLDHGAPGWDDEDGPAVILGAGGAARSIVHALVANGRPVIVANRSADKANALAAASGAKAIALEHLGDALAEASVFVNATSLGMEGEPPLTVDLAPMRAKTTVADIVYVPLETPLLADARARGLRPVDGLGMLLHQATVGFQRWFGLLPEVDEALRRQVAATL